MSDPRESLVPLLESSSHLVESKKGEYASAANNLQALLEERLQQYFSSEKIERNETYATLRDVQLATAKEALTSMEKIEQVLVLDHTSGTTEKPLLGTRDLAQLRTMVALIFKWGTEPLMAEINETWTVDTKGKGRRIVQVDEEDRDYATVASIVSRIMKILFPMGVQGSLSPTMISTTLTNKHLVDILRCSIPLGWLPQSLSTPATPTVDHLRPYTMRLLSMYVVGILWEARRIDVLCADCHLRCS